jgi:beta-glucosidase
MSMGNTIAFLNATKFLLEESPEYMGRLKDSARRVIKLKIQLGLFDSGKEAVTQYTINYPKKLGLFDAPDPGDDDVAKVRSDLDIEKSLEMARESIVMLQNNDSTLPIPASSEYELARIHGQRHFPNAISVKEGLEVIAGDKVTYFNGLEFDGDYSAANMTTAKDLASQAEYTVAVIVELQYAERSDDINDQALPAGHVRELASTGSLRSSRADHDCLVTSRRMCTLS